MVGPQAAPPSGMVICADLLKVLVTMLVAASALLAEVPRLSTINASAKSIAPNSTMTLLVDNRGTRRVRLMETFLSVGSRRPGVVDLLTLLVSVCPTPF